MHPDLSTLPGRGPLIENCAACGQPFRRLASDKNRRACTRRCRDVLRSSVPKQDPVARFWAKVVKGDGCWVRGGGRLTGGYAAFNDGERPINASRYAWIIATGDTLTRRDFIGHVCDNPPCVRNDDAGVYEVRGIIYRRRGHLFRTTARGNVEDMVEKHRHRPGGLAMPGERNPNARLTERDVRAIRATANDGTHQNDLAAHFGVTAQMIRLIVLRKNWKHVI